MSKKRSDARREERRQQAQRDKAAARKAAGATSAAFDKQVEAFYRLVAASGPAYTYGGGNTYGGGLLAPRATPSEPPAPTFSECVVGYRQWNVDATGQLRAITMGTQVWTPGVNLARCCGPTDAVFGLSASLIFGTGATRGEAHEAPAKDCHCGLYGWNDFRQPRAECAAMDASGGLWALGAIAAWGDLRVHGTGFRASHACPLALAYDDATTPRVRDTLARVAAEYRIALVHVEALQAEAEQHGSPLPKGVRPQRPSTDGEQFRNAMRLYRRYGRSSSSHAQGWTNRGSAWLT